MIALVEKGQAFDLAIQAANRELESGIVKESFNLFTALVNKGQGIHPAIAAARKAHTFPKGEEGRDLGYGIRAYYQPRQELEGEEVQLFKILFENGYGFDKETIHAFKKLYEKQSLHRDYTEQERMLEVLRTLVEKGQGLEERVRLSNMYKDKGSYSSLFWDAEAFDKMLYENLKKYPGKLQTVKNKRVN